MKKDVNIEEIMNEIRNGIGEGKYQDVTNLNDLMRGIEWEIEENEYEDDILSFDAIPIVSFTPVDQLNCDTLSASINKAKNNCYIGSEFPVEGNTIKKIIKLASQKATRCTVIPLTTQINENNFALFECLEQAVMIIRQQQEQINNLSNQLTKITSAVNTFIKDDSQN